jgi:hypothetical protein
MTAEDLIRTVMTVGQAYLALGVVFALAFVLVLAPRLDPATRGSSIGFRLVIFPSVTLLWPMLALRWLRGRSVPTECNAHRQCAKRVSANLTPSTNGRSE